MNTVCKANLHANTLKTILNDIIVLNFILNLQPYIAVAYAVLHIYQMFA